MRSLFKMKASRLRRVCVLASAITGAWLVFAAPASAVIDPVLPAYDESPTRQTDAGGSSSLNDFGRSVDEQQRDEALLGFVREPDAQTQEEERRQTDWCLWFALTKSAAQIADPSSFNPSNNSPESVLVNNLTPCLAGRVPALGSNAAIILAVQYQVQLVQSQSPGLSAQDALTWLQQNGLSFDPQTWANWFTFAAQNLPPSNTV